MAANLVTETWPEGVAESLNWNNGTIEIHNSALSGNSATLKNGSGGNGGGIEAGCGDQFLGTDLCGRITLVDSVVWNNYAAAKGGGMWNIGGKVQISGSSLIGNLAFMAEIPSFPAGGGGIRNSDGGVVTIDANSLLTSNQAVYGGGIHSELGNTVTIDASYLRNNRAYRDGGGIYNEGSLDVNASVLSGNQASGGGAILNWKTGSVSISDNSRLEGNVAGGGGAIENGCDSSSAVCNATVTIDNNSTLRKTTERFFMEALFGTLGATAS